MEMAYSSYILNNDAIRFFLNTSTRYACQPHITLRWRHNGHNSVSNHQPRDCLLKRLLRRRSKKTSKLRVTGLCAGNSPRPVNSPHKWPVTRKMFQFHDVIMSMRRKPLWCHDNIIKWKQFPRFWPFVRGNHRSAVGGPHKGQWRGALMFSLICAWANGSVNNWYAGDLRRHRAYYGVTVVVAGKGRCLGSFYQKPKYNAAPL